MRSKNTGLPDALAAQLVEIVRGIRELELRKSPSISETIDWARTLAVLGVEELTASVLSDTAAVVVKYDRDVRRTLEALPRLVDPNATVPEHGTATGTATVMGTGTGTTTTSTTTRSTPRWTTARSTAARSARRRTPRAATTPATTGPATRCSPTPAAPEAEGDGGPRPRSFGAGLGRKRAL